MTVTYHSGRRLQGLDADRTATQLPAGAVGGWVELGRTTLGGTGDQITVSSLADKRYYMVLVNGLATSQITTNIRLGNGSVDSGSNYSYRNSGNGAADNTVTSTTFGGWFTDATVNNDCLGVGYIANYSSKEKLIQTWGVSQNTAGAANAPARDENVSKWVNTSNPLDNIDITNGGSGDYASGSEVVVLGYDPADTHTNNFWEELVGSASGDLGSDTAVNGTHSTGTFTAKKYLWCQWYGETNTGGGTNPRIRVGNTTIDTGNNYAVRYSHNGAADGTQTSRSDVPYNVDTGHTALFCNMFLINNSANEKLGIIHWIRQNTAGAANVPNRQETVFKWANTANQVDILGMVAADGAKVSAGAKWRVWGAD